MPTTIVMADSWNSFDWYCSKNGLDRNDRKKVVPLVTYSDVYRLYGKDLKDANAVRVGEVKPDMLQHFRWHLKRYGWTSR